MNSQGARGRAEGLRQLMGYVLAVKDPGMRFLRLMATMEAMGPREAILTLEALTRSARGGKGQARAVLIGLGGFENVRSHLSDAQFETWHRVAVELKSPMAPILAGTSAQLSAYASHGININEMLEDMPLGRRKSLARLRDRGMLDRLRHDKHPAVVTLLLQNPRLIESDVVLMAAARPTSSQALRVIAGHRKWSRRYSVRSALSQNPYTPPSIGISLLATLMVPDLKALAKNRKLHRSLREGARGLLGARGLILPEITEEDREAANVNTLDPTLAATVDKEGATLAKALLDAQLTLGRGEAGDLGSHEELIGEGEANTEAEAFLAGLGSAAEIHWMETAPDPEEERGTRGGAPTEGAPGQGAPSEEEANIRTASPLGEDRGDLPPEPEEPVVQALAQWFMDTMGPIELVPVVEAEDEAEDGPTLEPRAEELKAYMEPAPGEVELDLEGDPRLGLGSGSGLGDDDALSDDDRAALEFMKNLGEINLVPVGQGQEGGDRD